MAGRLQRLALAACVALSGAAAAFLPGCLSRFQKDETPSYRQCTACHGNASRAGTNLQKAAPPYDLNGNTTSEYPGVGAHMRHLYATSTHAAVACNQCHVVPKTVDAPGHADTKRPAEITFGSLASADKHAPRYDAAMRSCTDTYCHRDANPVWTHPRSEAETCGTCHSIPPPKPHPQALTNECGVCHSMVVDKNLAFVAPERHIDGQVEKRTPKCDECHGDPKNNNFAPPNDTHGNTSPTAPGVGAHQIHLAGGSFSRPLECKECHHVPTDVLDPLHIDGAQPAEVIFTGVARTQGRDPAFDAASLTCGNTWCHSPEPNTSKASPVWNSNPDKPLPCNGCHGTPPAPPHPQMTNCAFCHGAVVNADNKSIKNRSLHVNGQIDVVLPTACNSCHGSANNPAPPKDLAGDTATTAMGVGAHQIHLAGSNWARAVTCDECHVVPKNVTDPGHFDSALPAELTFSGAAVAFGAQPAIDPKTGTCSNVFCHGDSWVGTHQSGGTHTKPVWNQVDGTQATCGSCHALPPPPPHPVLTSSQTCNDCHKDVAPDLTFIRPDLHVDGDVTFFLPP